MSDYKKIIIERALKDKRIAEFDILESEIQAHILDIYKIYNVEDQCNASPTTDRCGSGGFHFKLVKNTFGKISLQSYPCPKNAQNKSFLINNNVIYSSVDLSSQHQLLNKNSLDYIDDEPDESETRLINFLLKVKRGQHEVGAYISGDNGTGKTFLTLALANELALENKKIAYVIMSNFALDIMQSIKLNNNDQATVVDKLKDADIVIFDDVGAEKYSNYVHAQIIIPIMNYRLAAKRTTFFLSKYNFFDLKKAYNSMSSDASIRIYIDKIQSFAGNNVFRLLKKNKKNI
ncbi:MAG: DnaA ATPase domain-containing protein [Mycoplasma sp.]